MIRIWRGAEPAELAKERRKYLARACLAWARGAVARSVRNANPQQPQQETIESEGYGVAREFLYSAQHKKCAYCERQEGLQNQPVEHFRPKAGAERDASGPSDIDDSHYFWLAWSWENLFFACTSCNGKGTKGNQFPLLERISALPVPARALVLAWPTAQFDRKAEKAMLVDPSLEDPMDFIQWLPENPNAEWEKLRWIPMNCDLDKRGDATIHIIGLRKDLPVQVSAAIRAHVVPKMARLQGSWQASDQQRARDVWDDVEKMFDVHLPYLAATYNAIEWFLEKMGLTDLHSFIGRRLEELRPGAREAEVLSTDIGDPAELASLPVELVLRIRANAWRTATEAVLALCSHCAWDDPATLASILGYETSTVLGAARTLVSEGRLQRTPAGGFGPR